MSLLDLSRATPEFRCSCSMGSLVRDRCRTGTLMMRFSSSVKGGECGRSTARPSRAARETSLSSRPVRSIASRPLVTRRWYKSTFTSVHAGFSNRNLREHFASLLGRTLQELGRGQMTYQLRRLRLHGIIERIPQSHRYRVTDTGLCIALFCTRTYARILRPGLAQALAEISCAHNSLRSCFNKLQRRSIYASMPQDLLPRI